jgi:DNA-binding response OmpR family regulator
MQMVEMPTYHLDGRERISRNSMSQSIAERGQMPTVLIVEDDSNIRHFVAVNLKARGYTVLQAENAEDGLQQLREHTPGALVLDIKLPGMSGWDMLKQIDVDPKLLNIPVIILTASPLSDHPGDISYSNIADKLVKPVSTADLMLAIRKACG